MSPLRFSSAPAASSGQLARGATWHRAVPRLQNAAATLREISVRDAGTLLAHLEDPIAQRHVAPCPATIDGLRRFARWAQARRRRGRLICFVIIPAGHTQPIGVIQLWPLDPSGTTAEWGVVIGRSSWGTGLFPAAAALLFQFVFEALGVVRLEARTAVANHRANAAMRKVGAREEGRLRSGVRTAHATSDAFLWSFPTTSVRIAARMAQSDVRGHR